MEDSPKSSLGRWRGLLGAASADPAGAPEPQPPDDGDEWKQALLLLRDYEESGLGWFWSTDANGRIAYVSACVARQLDRSRAELIGQPLQSLFVAERMDDDVRERTLPMVLSLHKKFADLAVRPVRGLQDVWWSISGRPQFSASGDFTGFRGNGVDVTEKFLSQREAARLATRDSLTGLSNRHRISQKLGSTLTAYAAARRSCAVMMIDLDRFKQVNDTLGHPAGDALLKQVAERLVSAFGEGAEVGRLGGDEFQVMLPDMDDRGELGELARKAISMLSQPYTLDEGRAMIGASVGIAIAPYDGIDSEALVRSADLALYAAKGGGRGQFRFYSADLLMEAERRRELERDLGAALEKEQMRLAYQPIVDAANKVVALQASLRWDHPDYDDLPPETFMPIAYESNLIGPLSDWAIGRACQDAVLWPGSVGVAVPVSPAQFANPGFVDLVTQALAASELNPERLEIQVPEAVFSMDDGQFQDHFVALKMLGIGIALDDFGTGYTALGRLRDAPFDKIRISDTFVREVSEDSGNDAIVAAIVGLAWAMNMKTQAVGVEAHDELNKLRSLHVDQAQGRIFSTPVSFDEVIEAMANGTWTIEPSGPSRYRDERRTLLRRVGLIHENYRYDVRIRNLSRTGCLIEGLVDVPLGTQFVVDFGGGQIAVANVRRSAGTMQGLEFELPLVDDGAGGLVTRNRVSPYALAAAGMPLAALPPGNYPLDLHKGGEAAFSQPRFAQPDRSAKSA